MAPPKRAPCQICEKVESKYTCPKCEIVYCSVICYKEHKRVSCAGQPSTSELETHQSTTAHSTTVPAPSRRNGEPGLAEEASEHLRTDDQEGEKQADDLEIDAVQQGQRNDVEEKLQPERPLRPLTSLKWPYVPDMPSYPDPLKRDDPKPLTLVQYEAIATSPAVRKALSSHPRLPSLLRSLDALRGAERERELQRILGVSSSSASFSLSLPSSSTHSTSSLPSPLPNHGKGIRTNPTVNVDEDDVRALRELAETIEHAVRGGKGDVLGLDWETA